MSDLLSAFTKNRIISAGFRSQRAFAQAVMPDATAEVAGARIALVLSGARPAPAEADTVAHWVKALKLGKADAEELQFRMGLTHLPEPMHRFFIDLYNDARKKRGLSILDE